MPLHVPLTKRNETLALIGASAGGDVLTGGGGNATLIDSGGGNTLTGGSGATTLIKGYQ